MIDSDIEQIMEQINDISGTSLLSFQTALLERIVDKEMIRTQLFNYSVAIYGYYENEKLLGLIYYQLPSPISFRNVATIYWINCEKMQKEMFKTLLKESAKKLFQDLAINKIKIHFAKSSFFAEEIESELIHYGFIKEAEIEHGIGWRNDLLVLSLLNN